MAGVVREEHGSQRIKSTGDESGSDDIALSPSSPEVDQAQASSTGSWQFYGMESKKKAIIVINTDEDEKCGVLTEMFNDLGFGPPKIEKKLNCTAIEEFLATEAEKMPNDVSCFACVVLSYGDDDYLFGYKGFNEDPCDRMNIHDQIMGHFKGDNCTQLVGKPKLYFIETPPPPKDVESTQPENAGTGADAHTIPVEADQLLVHSFLEDYSDLAFLDALKSSLKADGNKDILSMLTDMMGKISRAQTNDSEDEPVLLPFIMSSLTKQLVFPSVSTLEGQGAGSVLSDNQM